MAVAAIYIHTQAGMMEVELHCSFILHATKKNKKLDLNSVAICSIFLN